MEPARNDLRSPLCKQHAEESSHGDTFKEIRFLACYIEAYEPPVPDPDETRAQKILYGTLNAFFR